jgi:hypothetical protein
VDENEGLALPAGRPIAGADFTDLQVSVFWLSHTAFPPDLNLFLRAVYAGRPEILHRGYQEYTFIVS